MLKADTQIKTALQQNVLQGAYQLYQCGLVNYNEDMMALGGGTAAAAIHAIGLTGIAATAHWGRNAAHQRLKARIQDLQSLSDVEQRACLMAQAILCASQASPVDATQLARWWAAPL